MVSTVMRMDERKDTNEGPCVSFWSITGAGDPVTRTMEEGPVCRIGDGAIRPHRVPLERQRHDQEDSSEGAVSSLEGFLSAGRGPDAHSP